MKRTTLTFFLPAVAFVLALLLAPVASAAPPDGKGGGKGGGGKTSSATLELDLMGSSDDVARHGQDVSFVVSTAETDRPFVGVRCYQGSNWVLDGYVGFFDGYMFDPWLTLDSPYWADGIEVDCTARLFSFGKRGQEQVYATLDFSVAP